MEGLSSVPVDILPERFRATISDKHRSTAAADKHKEEIADLVGKYQEEIADCFTAVAQVYQHSL
jgi:hypothetical protein